MFGVGPVASARRGALGCKRLQTAGALPAAAARKARSTPRRLLRSSLQTVRFALLGKLTTGPHNGKVHRSLFLDTLF